MTSEAEDQDHGDPTDRADDDGDGPDEETDDDSPWESRIFGFLDWLSDDRSQGARYGLAFWVIAIVILCCGYNNWNSAVATGEKWYVEGKESIDSLLTTRQQLAMIATVGLLLVYYIWRRVQIHRGIKPVPWLLISLTVCVALGFTLLATWLMFREASNAPKDAAAQLRFDAVKTGITLFAGTAGAGALLLSFRSHFNSETDRLNSQFDSAADKMSDDSRVVQTAGIISVERIASKHKSYRRSAIAVLQAYVLTDGAQNQREALRVMRRFGERNPTTLGNRGYGYDD
ncbi:hypothetical protein ACIBD9_00360 [Micromonospora sp. NPDC050784]|uniref:hypothetical protein n=1 Tax=Micromonospora sp. NPDC050784 TaxID=3364281 RepID=UPI00379836A3